MESLPRGSLAPLRWPRAVSPILAGAAAGMLTASVFVSAGVLMVFSLVREPPPHLAEAARRLSSGALVFRLVVLSYPTWAFIGVLLGLAYIGVEAVNPGPGLGSPNLAFTLVVIVTAAAAGLPLFLILRRMAAGIAAICLAFAGSFGWLLPHFAS